MKLCKCSRGLVIVVAVIMIITAIGIFHFKGYAITLISPIFNSFIKSKVLNNVKDYKSLETENFIISYRQEEHSAAIITGRIAEKYYKDMCKMFNYYPDQKIQIIIYSDGREILQNTGLSKNTPPLGVYYGDTIHVLSPNYWIKQKDNFEYKYEVNGPIVHELAHLFVDRITKGNYPIWLTEGVALYTEYKMTGFEWGKGIEFEREISIDELTSKFYSINQGLAYRQSFEVIKSISDNWGFERIVLILNKLGEGNNLKDSTQTVLKIGINDLSSEFN